MGIVLSPGNHDRGLSASYPLFMPHSGVDGRQYDSYVSPRTPGTWCACIVIFLVTFSGPGYVVRQLDEYTIIREDHISSFAVVLSTFSSRGLHLVPPTITLRRRRSLSITRIIHCAAPRDLLGQGDSDAQNAAVATPEHRLEQSVTWNVHPCGMKFIYIPVISTFHFLIFHSLLHDLVLESQSSRFPVGFTSVSRLQPAAHLHAWYQLY
ncbi:hypothetical protein BKA93DRAFT_787708 [Sparassis latifolia]